MSTPGFIFQLEAQINTPQYTKKNLVINEIPADSLSPARFVESSVSINKTILLQPAAQRALNYRQKLDLGMGLQYSGSPMASGFLAVVIILLPIIIPAILPAILQ